MQLENGLAEMLDMEIDSQVTIDSPAPNGVSWVITRVPGGWIYTFKHITNIGLHSVFVPTPQYR